MEHDRYPLHFKSELKKTHGLPNIVAAVEECLEVETIQIEQQFSLDRLIISRHSWIFNILVQRVSRVKRIENQF